MRGTSRYLPLAPIVDIPEVSSTATITMVLRLRSTTPLMMHSDTLPSETRVSQVISMPQCILSMAAKGEKRICSGRGSEKWQRGEGTGTWSIAIGSENRAPTSHLGSIIAPIYCIQLESDDLTKPIGLAPRIRTRLCALHYTVWLWLKNDSAMNSTTLRPCHSFALRLLWCISGVRSADLAAYPSCLRRGIVDLKLGWKTLLNALCPSPWLWERGCEQWRERETIVSVMPAARWGAIVLGSCVPISPLYSAMLFAKSHGGERSACLLHSHHFIRLHWCSLVSRCSGSILWLHLRPPSCVVPHGATWRKWR